MSKAGQLHLGVVWLAQAVLPTLLLLICTEGYEAWRWAGTGNCPAMAPDIPPEPCTWFQFVDRDWGAFAWMGLVMYAVETVVLATWCVLAWAGDRRLRRAEQRRFRIVWLLAFVLPAALVFAFHWLIYNYLALLFAAPPTLVFVGLAAIAWRYANPGWARVE